MGSDLSNSVRLPPFVYQEDSGRTMKSDEGCSSDMDVLLSESNPDRGNNVVLSFAEAFYNGLYSRYTPIEVILISQ